jgi:hypothetical protein
MSADPAAERAPFIRRSGGATGGPPHPAAAPLLQRLLAPLVAILVGVYAGAICATLREAWLYAAAFCGEGLACALAAAFVRAATLKRSLQAIGAWFAVTGVATPLACWGCCRLGGG